MRHLELRFLGSGDAFGSGGRFQTCLLLGGPHGKLLLDCGASSLIAMKGAALDPTEIGWILVSHLHGDHFAGIPFLILDGHFSHRRRPLVVAGPPGIAERVKAASEILFPGSWEIERRFAVEFVDLRERRETTVGPVTARAFAVEHASGAPAYALQVKYGDRVVAYSGDTEWTESLVDAAQGADLFVCEAYVFEKKLRYHLDLKTLLSHRHRLECRRLIVTHMSDDLLNRREETSGVEYARDGLVIHL